MFTSSSDGQWSPIGLLFSKQLWAYAFGRSPWKARWAKRTTVLPTTFESSPSCKLRGDKKEMPGCSNNSQQCVRVFQGTEARNCKRFQELWWVLSILLSSQRECWMFYYNNQLDYPDVYNENEKLHASGLCTWRNMKHKLRERCKTTETSLKL